jgi:hypothetical protein
MAVAQANVMEDALAELGRDASQDKIKELEFADGLDEPEGESGDFLQEETSNRIKNTPHIRGPFRVSIRPFPSSNADWSRKDSFE